MPAYWTGISQPANGTSFAPAAAWRSYSGVRRSSVVDDTECWRLVHAGTGSCAGVGRMGASGPIREAGCRAAVAGHLARPVGAICWVAW